MGSRRGADRAAEATVGYAADEHGNGLAYARVAGPRSRRVLRVGFRVSARPVTDRATAYAALTAVTRALAKRGVRAVRLVVGDARFAEEVETGHGVAAGLELAYVGLRCALNSLAALGVQPGATDELTQRARAEVTLNVAA
jgi:hypothetical protein